MKALSTLLALAAIPAVADIKFEELMEIPLTDTVEYPTNVKVTPLFVGGHDMVTTKEGKEILSKSWNDFTGYIPIDGRSDSGYVIVNHERIQVDPGGDGGGMSVLQRKIQMAVGQLLMKTTANFVMWISQL